MPSRNFILFTPFISPACMPEEIFYKYIAHGLFIPQLIRNKFCEQYFPKILKEYSVKKRELIFNSLYN